MNNIIIAGDVVDYLKRNGVVADVSIQNPADKTTWAVTNIMQGTLDQARTLIGLFNPEVHAASVLRSARIAASRTDFAALAWLASRTPDQVEAYLDGMVKDQATAKEAIKKLGRALCIIARYLDIGD